MKDLCTAIFFPTRLCLLMGGLFFSQTSAQSVMTGLRYFSTREGLTNNNIHKIVQDKRGFIWLATDEGLDRYDGTVFTAFYHENGNGESLPSNTIRDMALVSEKYLVLATFDGVCLFDKTSGQCHTFRELDGPDYYSFNNDFRFVRCDRYHHIWAGSRTGLYLFNDSLQLIKKWINPSIKVNPYSYAELPFFYPDGAMGFLLNRVPYKFNALQEKFERDTLLERSLQDRVNVDFIMGNRFGLWWLYSDTAALFHLDSQNGRSRYHIPQSYVNKPLLSYLTTLHDSVIWCGDNGGDVIRFNMKDEKFIPAYFHFANAPAIGTWVYTSSILWDNEQNLWIGTVDGLYEYNTRRQHLQVFDTSFYFKEAPVKTADVNALLKKGEEYWVGTYGSGLFWIDPVKHISKHFHFHFSYKEVGRNWIWHIFPYAEDTLWLGTQDGLVWFNTKNHLYGLVKGHGLPSYIDTFTVMTMFKDSYDILWMGIGNRHGLVKYNLKTKHVYAYTGSMLPILAVTCMTEDENGDLWMASMNGGGLVHWHRKGDHFSVIHAHYNSVFKDDKIYAVYADKQGSVWFSAGTDGLGQYDFRSGVIRVYGREQGICSQLVTSIAGNSDHLWIGTFNGLSRFNIHTRQFKNYTTTDGFPDNYFIYVQCTDDSIYACGALTMSVFDDTDLINNPYAPAVYITDIQVQNNPVHFSSGRKIRIHYNQDYIRFDYTGINYINGQRNHYAYKLDGADSHWVQAGNNRSAVYAGLTPGEYTFRVKAANSSGIWSKNMAICTFVVVPPFWKTTWFILAIFLLGCGIFYLFYRYRLRTVIKMQRIRDRIASDLHDDMGASLSNINILSTMALQKQNDGNSWVGRTLENIRDDAQQMSEAIDDIVWMVNPKNDTLEKILARMRYYASELFEAKNIQYEIDFPVETSHIRLPMEKRRELFLIFKEAVNNIVKHSACTKALLTIEIEGNHLQVQMQDNGTGFDTGKESGGNGLGNMCRRAKAIGGRLDITSVPGNGCCLRLVL